ncbi:MAG: VanZ family protein [Saprospiraceae bacterium]|jgi:VanZ family protein|nr:VanZ family protein [Saprospiraceae bacterium]
MTNYELRMTNSIRLIKAYFPAFAWLIAIVFLSTKGGVSMPSFDLFQTDKLAHAGAYALLTGLILWGTTRRTGSARWIHGVATVLFASAFGALMEWVQFRFFPDRFFEYDDMLANAIGALAGWWVFVWFFTTKSTKKY